MDRRRLLIVLFALLIPLQVFRAVQVASKQPTDVQIWYEAARLAADGGDPYAAVPRRFPYIYPPLFLVAFEPLARMPYLPAVAAWGLVSSAAWVGIVLIALRLGWRDEDPPPWACAAVVLLPYRWVLNFFLHGQVDLVVCFALVVSFLLASRKRDVAAGAALAVAVIIKLLPVCFFAYWTLRGRWRVVLAGLGALALLFVAPAARYGPARFVELLGQWRNGPLIREVKDPSSDAQESNQGLAATVYRYGLPEPLTPPEDQAPALFHLTVDQVVAIHAGVALVVIALYTGVVFGSRHDARADLVCFALTFVVWHLVSRRSWGYHYVTMTVVYAALLGTLARADWPAAAKAPLKRAAIAAALLQNFYSPLLVGRSASAVLSSYGPTTLSFFVLIAGIALAVRRL